MESFCSGTSLLGSQILMAMLLWGTLSCATETPRVPPSLCPTVSLSDLILGFPHSTHYIPLTQGDELCLYKALNMVHNNDYQYVAILFCASWCPFSRILTPFFSTLSSLYPSIPHFAIEESSVRPSILSKYGVHGFPTLFILNSTMRVRHRGSRTLASLIGFYTDVTGISIASLNQLSLEKIGLLSIPEKHSNTDPETCPFSWARSPENLLPHETYLALATIFVVLRLLYFFPTLLICAHLAWRRVIQISYQGACWNILWSI